MKTQASAKSLPTSPRKMGLAAGLARSKSVAVADQILLQANLKAAKLLRKVLLSAVANAENNQGLNRQDLSVESIVVGAGATLKRFRPRSKGMAAPIKHRSSNVKLILSANNQKPATTKEKK